ncbi:MAG: four helix bundle protein [Candidatus Dojkabacteria bacterium]|nr:four helix bundle protein [Candidatus Dojkabacteria bacterium]
MFDYKRANNRIKSYKDLDVSQRSYRACIRIIKEVLPEIPQEEKFDLKDQLRRSSKAIPRLIAEGFAKKSHTKSFQRYLTDAIGENDETIVGLEQLIDLYTVPNLRIYKDLLAEYDIIGPQLYKLIQSWNKLMSKDQ